MNFDLSDEQRLLQQTVDDYLKTESPLSRLREFYDSDQSIDPVIWKGLGELGILGVQLPEAYGGAGLELLDLACVAERIGYAAAPGPFLAHTIAALALSLAGSDEQKEKWLPQLATGERVATLAFAEPGALWQPEQWKLSPRDGRISGQKENVLAADSADVILVGLDQGELALVEASSDGVHFDPSSGLDRTQKTAWVTFDDAICDLLPGGSGVSGRVRDAALVLLAADAYGGGQRCLELAVDYAGTREQFGRKIGQFQALKHQLANLALDIEPCRALAWYSAYAWDHIPEESARAAAHAKSHVTDRFTRVARGTVEAHGGIGYTWECEVHFWLKRAIFDRTFLGTPRVHRLRAADLAGW